MDDIKNKPKCQLMNRDEFVKYLNAQSIEIEMHKWIESEKVGYDLGNNAVREWVHKYAKQYRESYNQNKCNIVH